MPGTFETRTRNVVPDGVDGLPDYVDVFTTHLGNTPGNREVGAALNRIKDYLGDGGGRPGGNTVLVVNNNNNDREAPLDRPIIWKDFGLASAEILVGAAVYWDMNRTLYMATALDRTKFCMGVVYALRTVNGIKRADVCVAGPCKALLADTMDVSAGVSAAMRLSIHGGRLTNQVDEDTSVNKYNQELGSFLRYAVDASGSTQTRFADVSFSYSPPQ